MRGAMVEMCEWGAPDEPQTDIFGKIRRKLAFGAHYTRPKRQCSPAADARRAPNVNTRRPLLPPRDKRRRSRRDGDPFSRDDKGTAQRSLQSKALRYSLKPVNDSMRPPHVLLLSDSNPYSPKVNSMM